ncbi:hypothetical protein D3C71_1617190 [compost metagenome]
MLDHSGQDSARAMTEPAESFGNIAMVPFDQWLAAEKLGEPVKKAGEKYRGKDTHVSRKRIREWIGFVLFFGCRELQCRK